MKRTVKAIDTLLPQTQCGECGFAGCLPYAEAIAQGSVSIDRCPPGGERTVKKLALLLDIEPEPFLDKARKQTRMPSLAQINEAECIGCTKCIQACPVDAIIGSAKLMHSVIALECTGCGLCLEPCPVDCIELTPLPEMHYQPEKARERFKQKKVRALRLQHEKQQAYREKTREKIDTDAVKSKNEYIMAALARVTAKQS